MNPVALYDALNNLGVAVLFSEGEPDADRRRIARTALAEASLSALDAFPADSPEAAALNVLVSAVAAFREQVPA